MSSRRPSSHRGWPSRSPAGHRRSARRERHPGSRDNRDGGRFEAEPRSWGRRHAVGDPGDSETGGGQLMATAVAEPIAVKTRTRVPLPPRLRRPGWYRAAMFEVLGLGFAFGITALIRWGQHIHPIVAGSAVTTVALFTVPIF